ncbi:hypothetical protein MBLNU457_7669t1 [Dothideomycetes sp. NU457]
MPQETALITGATGGIGQATALSFAREGYNLALHYNTASSKLSSLVTSLHAAAPNPIKIETFQADLSSYPAVRSLHSAVISQLGPPTILFLNAGTTNNQSGTTDLSSVSIESFEATWRVNTASPYLLTQLCLPSMIEAGHGRIVFNSSVAGLTGGVVGPHYASSKAAVHGLVHWLAGNVAKKGVTVNAVAPALIQETGMLPAGGEELAKKIPVGRFGMPEEVAQTVLWMVKNAYVTNKIIAVDGGMVPR